MQLLVCIALSLSCSNLFGFVRCKAGGNEGITDSMKNMASGVLKQQMLSNVSNISPYIVHCVQSIQIRLSEKVGNTSVFH